MGSFQKLVIILILSLASVGRGLSHSIKQTNWEFSAGVNSNYFQKDIEGTTSGEYLMAKYKPFIVS